MNENADGLTPDGHADVPDNDRLEALAALRERLLESPSDADALVQAGAMLNEMGRFEEAAAHFSKGLLCVRCPLGPRSGWHDGAAGPSPRSRQQGAELHYALLVRLGDCYAATGDCRRAEMYYRAASALSPDQAKPYICLGTLALQRDDLDEANRSFEAALRAQPECGEAYCGSAVVYQRRGEHSRAFEMYLKSLELDTNNLIALLGLFQTSCQMGTFAKIIHYLEAYLKAHCDDTSVRFCLATLYARDGRLHDAKQAVIEVLRREPKAQAEKLLAEIDDALGGIDERQGAAR